MKSETYTFREAMACLGLKSKSAFYLLEDKYPEAFVLMNQGSGPGAQYHKTTLDRFVMIREYFRNGNYKHNGTEPMAA